MTTRTKALALDLRYFIDNTQLALKATLASISKAKGDERKETGK